MRSPSLLLAALMCALSVFVLGLDAAPQIESVTPWSDEQLTVEQLEHVVAVCTRNQIEIWRES